MFCEKCGKKNTKDALYCKYCGASLKVKEEKKEEEVKEVIPAQVVEEKKEPIGNVYLKLIKGMFTKPNETIKEFVRDENYADGLLFLGINIIVIALSIMLLVREELISLGLLNYNYYYTTEIPYLRILLTTILVGAIYYLGISGFTYLIAHYIKKDNTSFKKLVAWLGVNSIFSTIMIIISLLLVLINVSSGISDLGLVVFALSSVVYTYNQYSTLKDATDINENHIGYVLAAAYLLTIIVIVIFL